MPIDIFEALKWVGLGLAMVATGLCLAVIIVKWWGPMLMLFLCILVAGFALDRCSRATDKRESDLIHLSLCRKQAVTPQDFADCK